MQETFMHAYLHLTQFEQRSSFKTWLIRIMLNNCYHFQRRISLRKEVSISIHENDVPMFANERSTDASAPALRRELAHVIESALVRIPRDYREVFVMRDMNNLSVADTSALLHISESNVKVRLLRARAMLRQKISSAYSPEDIFEFNLIYCDAMVSRIMQKIRTLHASRSAVRNDEGV
jgi:RNA polymerase sigma-70 factor (ECF subfamily)